MSRIPNLVKASLILVAFVVLGVLVVLVFGSQTGSAPATPMAKVTPTPTAQATPTPVVQTTPTPPPYPPPGSPTPPGPPLTPTSVPVSIPPCAFVAAPVPTTVGPSLDAYVFSEPRVVLTHTSAIGIAGWLPDGERLLITRLIPPALQREYIETFNVQTGAVHQYGERRNLDANPVWLDSEQAVAFADVAHQQWVLRIGRGKGTTAEEVVAGLASLYLAASPDNRRLVFLPEEARGRPHLFEVAQARREVLPFVLPSPPQPVSPEQITRLDPYKATWHPDGNKIAFYNESGFYLADLSTGQTCEVDLGPHVSGKRWAVDARWSPDGRYLAALTTVGKPIVPFIDLTLIDAYTGERYHLDLGLQYLFAITWAPNSRDL